MSTLKTLGGPQIHLAAVCLDCKIKHEVRCAPGTDFLREMDEWQHKHWGHRIEFFSPQRLIPRDLDDAAMEKRGVAPWWLEFQGFRDNANIKIAYAGAQALTITLASLASDSNLLAGRGSAVVDNTVNLYLDAGLSGQVTTGTSPTASKEIDVWAYAASDDVPTYPDAITGTDAGVTITTTNILNQALVSVGSASTSSTSNEKNYFKSLSVASLFGGFYPHKWGIWVVHNTVAALNSTGGNHFFNYKACYATAV
jgi:hypothetical protein